MATDDLNAPLGRSKKSPPKLPIGAPQALASLLGLFGMVVVSWALFVNDPLGGEPVAVVATNTRPGRTKPMRPAAPGTRKRARTATPPFRPAQRQ